MLKHLTCFLLCLNALFIMSACSHHSDLQTFNEYYYSGQDIKAYEYAKSKTGKNGDVLWNLQAGMSGFSTQTKENLMLLEQGEMLFSKYEAEGLMGGIFGNIGAMLVNENVKNYRGNIYEGVIFNYYKALNAMAQGNYGKARVEFNRANDRQRRAKDYFRKDIQKALEEENKQNAQNSTLRQIDTHNSSRAISPILEQQYSNLKAFQAYEGFINPAVSYVSALFFMSEGDYAKAMDLYKESYGITKAKVIDEDLKVLQRRKSGRIKQTYTWLIIEDGRSAMKYDTSLNLPSFYVSSEILHIGVSIPTLVEGKATSSNYQAQSYSGETFQAYEISDMDKVIANEFQKQLPFILTRAITSAILKATTQAALSDQLGTLGALAGAIYSAGTTNADIRISTALPKRILAMQIPNDIGNFTLKADSRPLFHIHFECIENNNSPQNESKSKTNLIYLCHKNDNILYLRHKSVNPFYRILKGGT
ncbi:hypothetical protein [uncultured Helicobacter sp.]|uniref:hypothetical protein n=4 Tax=uncultured Helicobacter sp. TaxID=175537 RepID=UPI0025DE7E56|nr:hypothetical protein [uncultured Helicobacter sp.]